MGFEGRNNPTMAASSKLELLERDYKSFLASPAQPATSYNTLDEPIVETIVNNQIYLYVCFFLET